MPRTGDIYKMPREIIQGMLSSGERCVQTDLCKRLGSNRGYAREALKLPRADGFVILSHGRGATVTKISYQETKKSKSCGWLKTCSFNDRSFKDSGIKDPLRKDTVTSMPRHEAKSEIELMESVRQVDDSQRASGL